MAILLTGGAGKTASRLARLLQDAKIPFLMTSRKGQDGVTPGMPAIKFDWMDESTYDAPFHYQFSNGEKVSAIYLVCPPVADPSSPVIAFIDHAKKYGVSKFVLLTGSTTENGGGHAGGAWKHLDEIGVEYAVLKATWFMENFSEREYVSSIKDEGKIYTACEDGKIPFVSANDIAAVAFHALTSNKIPNTSVRVLGPELLSFDQAAEILSKAFGRKIEHVRVSEEESFKQLTALGLPERRAKLLFWLQSMTAKGSEEFSNLGDVEMVTGRPGQTFDAWVEENIKAWD